MINTFKYRSFVSALGVLASWWNEMGDGQAVVEGCHPYALFDRFVQASTCRETLRAFQELCTSLNLQPGGKLQFYRTLRSKLHYWKAKALWAKLDKRAGQKEYQRGLACSNTTVIPTQ